MADEMKPSNPKRSMNLMRIFPAGAHEFPANRVPCACAMPRTVFRAERRAESYSNILLTAASGVESSIRTSLSTPDATED